MNNADTNTELISSIVDNSLKVITKGGNVTDKSIASILVDTQYKNGGLITISVSIGYKE